MSVQDFLRVQNQLCDERVLCWAIVANPVTANYEHYVFIALFDVEADARAYVEASALEKSVQSEGYCRTFRPDSLLYCHNRHAGGAVSPNSQKDRTDIVFAMCAWHAPQVPANKPINPQPPTGPCPELLP